MSITSIISSLSALTDLQWGKFKTFGEYLFRWGKSNTLYEVLANEIELEIVDTKGQLAFYRKRKHVRFQQDDIFAFLDTAYGDGDIFNDYQCSPGQAVDFYEEGYHHRVLISLRETKQRGDEEIFHIQRRIKSGFTEEKSYLQTDIRYPTSQLQVILFFPEHRHPKAIWLIEKNMKNTSQLQANHIKVLPDGRCQVIWEKKKPCLYEGYILSWLW